MYIVGFQEEECLVSGEGIQGVVGRWDSSD